jgi:hypothetical protein
MRLLFTTTILPLKAAATIKVVGVALPLAPAA